MGFQVTYQSDLPEDGHGDHATYEFMEDGVLEIEADGQTFCIAPNIWHTVMADPDHTPGRAKREPGQEEGRTDFVG